MENRFNFSRTFHTLNHKLSLVTITALILALLFTAGCSDSDPYVVPAAQTETPAPLVDAEWFAFQDGDGPWQEIELPESGVFTPDVTDPDGRYSIAYLRADGDSQALTLETFQGTTAELPQIDVEALIQGETSVFEVTVEEPQNIENSSIYLYFRDEIDGVYNFTDTQSYTAAPGTYDLFVTQNVFGSYNYPANYIARRNITLNTDAETQETITAEDFDSSTAFAGPYTITVQGDENGLLDSTTFSGEVNLITENFTDVELGDKSDTDNSFQYSALPAPLAGNDMYRVSVNIDFDENNELYYAEGFKNAGNNAVTVPELTFDAAFEADTSTGKLLPGISSIPALGAGNVIGYSVRYRGNINGIEYTVMSFISGGRIQSDSFTMPDLASAEGWTDNWSIPTGAETEYTVMSAHIGSDGTLLQNMANWFSNSTLFIEDGDWYATVTKRFSFDDGVAR